MTFVSHNTNLTLTALSSGNVITAAAKSLISVRIAGACVTGMNNRVSFSQFELFNKNTTGTPKNV